MKSISERLIKLEQRRLQALPVRAVKVSVVNRQVNELVLKRYRDGKPIHLLVGVKDFS